MLRVILRIAGPLSCALFALSAVIAQAGPLTNGVRVPSSDAPPTDRIIVRWREDGVAAVRIGDAATRTAQLAGSTGLPLRGVRALGSRLDVLRLGAEGVLERQPSRAQLEAALVRLRMNPSVASAEADERIYVLAAPNDPRFTAGSDIYGSWAGQWYLQAPSTTTPSAIGAVSAWDLSRGTGINVAVLDTGVRMDHPDLAGKLLAGRDFVCHDNLSTSCTSPGTVFLTAADGDGWDADPSDPGDFISASDLLIADPANPSRKFFAGCGEGTGSDQPIDSTWHGTKVAGYIAAVTNNGIGIAGAAPDARIVPIRTIGKCTGYTSDLVAALYWAAGISDASLGTLPPATSANTAHVINLSLGNRLACSSAEQTAIDAVIARGIVIVAAAGNDGGPVGAPANCKGVLSVAGLRHTGTKVGYSNVSSTAAAISIGAPAGNCVNTAAGAPCLYSLDTLSNTGRQTPDVSDKDFSYTYSALTPAYTGNTLNGFAVGTSFAAPLVSSVAALMKSVHPRLTPAQIIQRMQDSSAAFPVPATPATGGVCHVAALTRDSSGTYTDVQDRDCQCTTATCGAGMVNATAAVAAALRPIAAAAASSTVANVGQRITLDGSGSSAAAGHALSSYAWTSEQGVSIGNADGAVAQISFPALRPITLTLTVTDDAGRRDSTSVTIESTLTSPGGGGALSAPTLLLLGTLLTFELRRRRLPASRSPINRN
jgi:serine protease